MDTVSNTEFLVYVPMGEGLRELSIRPHPGSGNRYRCRVVNGYGQPIEFALIRTMIGKWVVGGELLPDGLAQQAEAIGQAIQANNI